METFADWIEGQLPPESANTVQSWVKTVQSNSKPSSSLRRTSEEPVPSVVAE
jgi:hypothetical protein